MRKPFTGKMVTQRTAKAVPLTMLLGRLSAVGLVLFNVFVWALFGLPTEADAAAVQSVFEASATISALEAAGVSAKDICAAAGMQLPGKGGAHVCPHCCTLNAATHAILLPGELALPSLDRQGQRLSPWEPGEAPASKTPRPWLARGPPLSA